MAPETHRQNVVYMPIMQRFSGMLSFNCVNLTVINIGTLGKIMGQFQENFVFFPKCSQKMGFFLEKYKKFTCFFPV